MGDQAIQWLWSADYRRYYYVTYINGKLVYNWQAEVQAQAQPPTWQTQSQDHVQPSYDPRVDSGNEDDGTVEPVPDELRASLPGLIAGTPGWTESLDPSYSVRTGGDARRFFVQGRVFAMLYSEAAGFTSSGNDDAYSLVRYNEIVYSTIRRFVVVDVRHGFVYACAISTYGNRATKKSGCVPSEHAVVYFTGTDPSSCYLDGETARGQLKEPIEVHPAGMNLFMKRESRIRFSKTIPVEMNVKVKDIGRVSYSHMTRLIANWREEFDRGY